MNQKEKNKIIATLVRKCIGERSLKQTSIDTEAAILEMKQNGELISTNSVEANRTKISINMLARLKNEQFSAPPSIEIFKVLTHIKAKPQNNITINDFEKIIDTPAEKTPAKKFIPINKEILFLGIMINHLNQYSNNYRILNQLSKEMLVIESDNKINYYDLFYLDPYITSQNKISEALDSIILKIIKTGINSLKNSEMYNIVVTNAALYNQITNMNWSWNTNAKINFMLLSYSSCSIIDSYNLN